MKKLALLSCFALLGACSNYTMAEGEACADDCTKPCCASTTECADKAQCTDMAKCCAEAKAAGKECADCTDK